MNLLQDRVDLDMTGFLVLKILLVDWFLLVFWALQV